MAYCLTFRLTFYKFVVFPKYNNIMAKQIKLTPVLRNKDACNFYRKLEENKASKVSTIRMMEIKETTAQFKAILNAEIEKLITKKP